MLFIGASKTEYLDAAEKLLHELKEKQIEAELLTVTGDIADLRGVLKKYGCSVASGSVATSSVADTSAPTIASASSTSDQATDSISVADSVSTAASASATFSVSMDICMFISEAGLSIFDSSLEMRGDFMKMLPRLKHNNLSGELLVKAARIKNTEAKNVSVPLMALDATAGMGEDSLLLAASGFDVDMYEYDPVIAALLDDTLKRAADSDELAEAAGRMHLHKEDSIKAMREMVPGSYDVVLLDPMFPQREKSALIKKKFQLIHQLERPCADEEDMFEAAAALKPRKLIVKRPVKGAFLAGRKPSYSLSGKAVRYDCYINL